MCTPRFVAKQVTCRTLVASYLARIDALDQRGPALNAIVVVNPAALAEADALDTRFEATGAGRATALRAHNREGQLRDDRPAKRGGLARVAGLRLRS